MAYTKDLTQGKELPVLLRLAIPIMMSSLLQMTYNFVDMIFVGRLGSDAIASVGTAGSFINLGYAINALVVIGAGIKISHAVGAKDQQKIGEYLHATYWFNGVLAIGYALFLLIFLKPLISFFDLGANVSTLAQNYLAISAIMLIPSFFNVMYSRIFSSFGDSKTALRVSAIGVIVNLILDPIFIFGLDLGVAGAALATVLANILMTGLFVWYSRHWMPKSMRKLMRVPKQRFQMIAKLGFPMTTQRVLFTLIGILMAKLIAFYGADAIAAQKIGLQIESLTFMVIGGLNAATASFIGQNYGAQLWPRIRSGYRSAIVVAISYTVITTTIFLVFPEPIVKIFVDTPATVQLAVDYLRIIGLAQLFSAVEMVTNGAFSGLGQAKYPAIISITFTALRLPIAIVLMQFIGLNGVWWSLAISSALKGIIAYRVFQKKGLKKDEEVIEAV
ncbi:MAG: MATE family efflux transporter [Culicoidibacterales bacterium]